MCDGVWKASSTSSVALSRRPGLFWRKCLVFAWKTRLAEKVPVRDFSMEAETEADLGAVVRKLYR